MARDSREAYRERDDKRIVREELTQEDLLHISGESPTSDVPGLSSRFIPNEEANPLFRVEGEMVEVSLPEGGFRIVERPDEYFELKKREDAAEQGF